MSFNSTMVFFARFVFKYSALNTAFCASLVVLFSSTVLAQSQSSVRIEELTISATRLPRTIENIAGTVSLISSEDIEREIQGHQMCDNRGSKRIDLSFRSSLPEKK